jgi:two-component system sensor histidine kinase/response regulator
VLGMYALGAHPDERRTRAAGLRAVLAKPIKQTQLFNLLSVIRLTLGETATLRPDQDPARRRRGRAIASNLPPEVRARTRILLVEDSPVNQRVQMRILERIGFAADTANNGQEALAALEQHPYDIVLMDCQMPGLDGYNATREIRRRETNGWRTVIIGVTANALSGDREECLAIGMDDYVAKPVAPEDLAAMLEKWVTPAVTP